MAAKNSHTFPMILIVCVVVGDCFVGDVAAASASGFQHSRNSLEPQRNLSDSFVSAKQMDGYVEDYIQDDPAAPPNFRKEKLLYTKEISIKQGRIKGIVRNFQAQTGLKEVDQYLGIPYAEPPIGSRRFMPPGKNNFIILCF